MFKIRAMFLALLVAIAVMSGVIPAAAQATGACPLLDSVMTADGFRLSVFGDGGVIPAPISDQVAVTLDFHVDEHSPACSGEQSAILIVDAHEVAITPPYHVRINEAWITFTDQFALGLASTRDRMILSPLDGTVVVLSEFTNNVTIVPLGYTTQIGLDGAGGSVTGDWQANAAMDGVSLATLRNLAFEHPELALATPTDEQAMTAAQTIAANPPQAVQPPVIVAVPDAVQPAQMSTNGQPPQTAPAQSPSNGQQPPQTAPAGGQQGQPSTGAPSGQSSGNTSGQTTSGNSSGQGSSNGESGQARSGEDQSGQSSSSGRTTEGTGNQGTIGTIAVPPEDLCAQLGPGCVPAIAGSQVGGTGPNPCNGCRPGIAVEIEQPNVIINPLPDAVRPIDIGLNDRIHIDELPYDRMPQVNGPGF